MALALAQRASSAARDRKERVAGIGLSSGAAAFACVRPRPAIAGFAPWRDAGPDTKPGRGDIVADDEPGVR